MKRFLKFIVVVSIFAHAACTPESVDYSDEIADLTDRVEALESLEDALTAAVSGVETLVSASTGGELTIASITMIEEGVYKIVLSNGEIVYAGSSINYAAGTITMRVTDEGNWQYSDDGGATWNDVTDSEGNTVPVVTEGSAWYDSVGVENGYFTFTLEGDDTVYTIPIIENFTVIIDDSAMDLFAYEGSQTLPVTITGASNVVINCPAGWSAQLADEKLTIMAPAAGYDAGADTSSEVRLMIFSGTGFVRTTSIEVGIDPDALIPPVASITSAAVNTMEQSITFSVSINSAVTNLYYICKPSSEAAPEVADFTQEIELSSVGSVTTEKLTGDVTYTLYVLAANIVGDESLYSSVITKSLYVPIAPVDYYTAGYAAENGITYSSASEGAVLITEDTTITTDGVYFIEGDAKLTVEAATYSQLVLIGRYDDTKGSVEVVVSADGATTVILLSSGEGLVMKNVDVLVNNTSYMANFSDTDQIVDSWIIEDCRFETYEDKGITYFSKNNCVIRNVYYRNNVIKFNVSSSTANPNARFIAFNNTLGDNAPLFTKCEVTNNYAYASVGLTGIQVCFANATNTPSNDFSNLELYVANNIFINSSVSSGCIVVPTAKSVISEKNIFWAESDRTIKNYYIRYTGSSVNVSQTLDDIYYGGDSSSVWYIYTTTSTWGYDSSNNKFTAETTDPLSKCDFENEIFTVSDQYAAYGPQAN